MNHAMEASPLGEGLSGALLRVIDDAEKVDWLREILCGFNHRCRNSLNGMKLGFYLCKRESSGRLPPVWRDLEQTYELIERTIDRLQLIYRPLSLTLVESNLGSMIAEREASWRLAFAERGKALVIDHPSGDRPGQFDPMYLEQGLDALVSWRAEASPVTTRARLGWQCQGDQFLIQWNEEEYPLRGDGDRSGPSEARDPQELFPRQVDSLALPLLARIIRAHEGRLFHTPTANLSLRMSWPLVRGASLNY